MQRTAASIVTASKCAPITPRTTSSVVGVIAVARRAITFLSGLCFSGKCAWARTSRILGLAHLQNRRVLLRVEGRLPQLLRVEEQVPRLRLRHKVLQTKSEPFSCNPSCLARASRFARDCELARASSCGVARHITRIISARGSAASRSQDRSRFAVSGSSSECNAGWHDHRVIRSAKRRPALANSNNW